MVQTMARPPNEAWELLRAARDGGAELTHAEKVLLLVYATFAKSDGTDIFPSDPRAARALNCSVDTVRRARHGLVAKGYIEVQAYEPGKNPYHRIVLAKVGLVRQAADPPPELQPGANGNKPPGLRTTKLKPAAPPPSNGWDDEAMRINNYKWYVFTYYGAFEKKGFANQQETQDYQNALNQLMQLGISEMEVRHEYEQQKG